MSAVVKKFLSKKKGPAELVASLERNIKNIATEDVKTKEEAKTNARATEKITLNLLQMKFMLYGDGDNDAKPDNIKKLVDLLFARDLLLSVLQHVEKFEFEARKDVAQIYNFVLRFKPPDKAAQKHQAVEYIQNYPQILDMLVKGYSESDIALNCGSILREVIRHEELNLMLLNNKELFEAFFGYVQLPTFDVASDAFATFKLMLTKHRASCAQFLNDHFSDVFDKYNVLLQSRNYVTKRQSLKLLGELLLNRTNFNVMIKYINSAENLKIIMNLLRGTTKAIQFEAFHVFKIFVANPKKSRQVLEILVRNKDKLIEFLTKFQKDKDDEQFNEDKKFLLRTLDKLEPPAPEEAA